MSSIEPRTNLDDKALDEAELAAQDYGHYVSGLKVGDSLNARHHAKRIVRAYLGEIVTNIDHTKIKWLNDLMKDDQDAA